jgi:hypothetical protein
MPTPVSPDARVDEMVGGPVAPERLDEMRAALTRFWSAAAAEGTRLEPGWRTRFEAAVMETAGRAVGEAYPPEYKPGNVKLRLRLYADRVEAIITDRGVPFEEPPAPEGLDRFEYSRRARGANRWRLVKRLPRV